MAEAALMIAAAPKRYQQNDPATPKALSIDGAAAQSSDNPTTQLILALPKIAN
jgi:hypothetical protein